MNIDIRKLRERRKLEKISFTLFAKVLTNSNCIFQSRAALSLLAYCYFYMQDFVNAANCYEHLMLLFPDIEEYRMYYAQALYQVG